MIYFNDFSNNLKNNTPITDESVILKLKIGLSLQIARNKEINPTIKRIDPITGIASNILFFISILCFFKDTTILLEYGVFVLIIQILF